MPSRRPDAAGGAAKRPDSAPAGSPTRLRITLVRSLIGLKPNHVKTLKALGLRRIRATVVHADTPAVRGMVARVPYAVRVEEERGA